MARRLCKDYHIDLFLSLFLNPDDMPSAFIYIALDQYISQIFLYKYWLRPINCFILFTIVNINYNCIINLMFS